MKYEWLAVLLVVACNSDADKLRDANCGGARKVAATVLRSERAALLAAHPTPAPIRPRARHASDDPDADFVDANLVATNAIMAAEQTAEIDAIRASDALAKPSAEIFATAADALDANGDPAAPVAAVRAQLATFATRATDRVAEIRSSRNRTAELLAQIEGRIGKTTSKDANVATLLDEARDDAKAYLAVLDLEIRSETERHGVLATAIDGVATACMR